MPCVRESRTAQASIHNYRDWAFEPLRLPPSQECLLDGHLRFMTKRLRVVLLGRVSWLRMTSRPLHPRVGTTLLSVILVPVVLIASMGYGYGSADRARGVHRAIVTWVVVNNFIAPKARKEREGGLKSVLGLFAVVQGGFAHPLCFMACCCFLLLALQNALKRKISKRGSKLVLLSLNYGEVGLNGCCAWKHDGKAAMAHLPRGIYCCSGQLLYCGGASS
jgi:hypothetical protein